MAETAEDENADNGDRKNIFRGGPGDICSALLPVVTKYGQWWAKYPVLPSNQLAKSELDQERMKTNSTRETFRALANIGAEHMTKAVSTKAMEMLCEKQISAGKWQMSGKEKGNYVEEFDLRVRTICFQVSKALNKKPASQWALDLKEGRDPQDDDGTPVKSPKPPPIKKQKTAVDSDGTTAAYKCCWDPELLRGYRVYADGNVEFAVDEDPEEKLDANDAIQFRFEDGSICSSDATTVGTVRKLRESRSKLRDVNVMEELWGMESKSTGNWLSVCQKKDNKLLLLFKEQSKVLFSLVVDAFGTEVKYIDKRPMHLESGSPTLQAS